MKILIVGYKRSGKDTAAEFWHKHFGMTFKSSSIAACEIFLFDALKAKYSYNTPEECFHDRHDKRAEWYELIKEYNRGDPARLASKILETSDCYVGMRNKAEIDGSRHLFDLVVWIDADARAGVEGEDSCTITKEVADIIIENNGTREEFEIKLLRLGNILWSK